MSQPDAAGLAFLREVASLAAVSVDRLDQIPERLRFLFDFEPHTALEDSEVSGAIGEPGAVEVIRALAEALAAIPRLDQERFRAAVGHVRQRTGFKGRRLFHPVRVALTGRTEGMELDQAVPAIDRGAELPLDSGVSRILGCRERAAAFHAALGRGGSQPCERQ